MVSTAATAVRPNRPARPSNYYVTRYICARRTPDLVAPSALEPDQVASGGAGEPKMSSRFVHVLRKIARGGLAGAIAGILVAGLGGRLVMRAAAALNPEATGLRTENGELVGAITANGTLALLIFGGLFGGLVAGVVWVVVSPWLPWTGGRRLVAATLGAVGLGGPLLIRSDNNDFRILESDGLILAMLLALVALVGLAIGWLDGRLDRLLPRPAGNPWRLGVAYGVIAFLGLFILQLAVGAYLSSDVCGCLNPPRPVGWALIAVGFATAVSWADWIDSGREEPRRQLLLLGRLGLLAALVLGTVRMAGELTRILGTV
jgi:hypothetical protein